MERRLIAIVLLLVTVLQVPAQSYAATIGGMTHSCGSTLVDVKSCNSCCVQGSMPSCATLCPVAAVEAALLMLSQSFRIPMHGTLFADVGVAPFADFDPPSLLRPPIS